MTKTSEFDYSLPLERIAQSPLSKRDASRLLVLQRSTSKIEHRKFWDLTDYLQPGDILVINDTRVIKARLFGRKDPTGGHVELLLLEKRGDARWQVLVGGRRLVTGTRIILSDKAGLSVGISASVVKELEGSVREVEFDEPIETHLDSIGHVPLPPYIHENLLDPERYQTIFSHDTGSAAAPTAGLHFSPELMLKLREKGILIESITLHVGLDTFKPVESEDVAAHIIHSEWARLKPQAARRINEAKLSGGRIVAVGTTCVRILETAALRSAGITGSLNNISQRDMEGETYDICPWRPVAAFEGRTDLFIYPGYRYRAVDVMITNFHLPRSTLLMLVAAFVGTGTILETYRMAVEDKYRFFSFGDAMLIY